MLKEMCIEAGIPVRTNHPLRATGATTMFQGCMPENIIQKTTGHRSVEGLRMYERVLKEQHQAVSNLMMSGALSFQDELAKSSTGTLKQLCQPTSSGACASTSSKAVASGEHGIRSLFGDLTNYTIGKLTININAAFTVQRTIEEAFDELVRDADFDFQ